MKVQGALIMAAGTALLAWRGDARGLPEEQFRRIFENERVLIWTVASDTRERPPVREPRLPGVWVSLADGSVQLTNERPDRTGRAVFIELTDHRVAPLDVPPGVPPAFPREGATRVIENDRLTVWTVTWVTGARTPMHFHDKDVVAVYLGPGTVRSTTIDGTSAAVPRSLGEAVFLPRGRTHVEECIAGPRRDVIIELK